MKKTGFLKVVLIVSLSTLMPMIVTASNNKGQGRPQGPPPEAIAACEGKSAGDSVTFTGRRGETLEATCQEKDGQMAAVPENMPKDDGRE